jgi:peptidoglycan hydrolase-like protein with peptidoglycan-binding domain
VAPGQTAPTATTSGAATTAAGRVVSNPSASVHLGDSGSGVRQIQTALAAHGYKVAVDGQFGPQTSQAVKDFQKKNGLTQDGVVGPVTWAKLQASSSTSSTTSKGTTTTTAKKTTTTT